MDSYEQKYGAKIEELMEEVAAGSWLPVIYSSLKNREWLVKQFEKRRVLFQED